MQDIRIELELKEDDMFTKYIDKEKAAEIESKLLREVIVATVISNTAAKVRVDADYYNTMTEAAKKFIGKTRICLFINDEQTDEFNFYGSQTQIKIELERLFRDIVCYQAWYEDSISYNGSAGFCWQCDEQKVAIC